MLLRDRVERVRWEQREGGKGSEWWEEWLESGMNMKQEWRACRVRVALNRSTRACPCSWLEGVDLTDGPIAVVGEGGARMKLYRCS